MEAEEWSREAENSIHIPIHHTRKICLYDHQVQTCMHFEYWNVPRNQWPSRYIH